MSFRRICGLLLGNQDNEKVKRFIKNGNLYNTRDLENNTLLHHAATSGNHEIVQYLIDSGNQIDARNYLGRTPLISVFENVSPCKKVIEILLKAGANIFLDGNDGNSAWMIVECTEWLLENIERFDIYKVFLENATNFDAFELLKTEEENVIQMVLQTNIDLSMVDSEGATIFHILAKNKNPNIMDLLKNKGLDINVRDNEGWTPLMYAALDGSVVAIEFLLREGADTEISDLNNGQTALFIACDNYFDEKEYKECVQVLLEHGANAQMKVNDRPNFTILDLLLEYDFIETGELVLAHLALQETSGIIITQLIRSKIDSHQRFKTYFESCKQLLSKKIYGSITLFDLLAASKKKLEHYLRDTNLAWKILEILTTRYFDRMLRKRFKEAISVLESRKAVAPVICELMKMSYNSYPFIVDEIASYLEVKDIECLILISKGLSC